MLFSQWPQDGMTQIKWPTGKRTLLCLQCNELSGMDGRTSSVRKPNLDLFFLSLSLSLSLCLSLSLPPSFSLCLLPRSVSMIDMRGEDEGLLQPHSQVRHELMHNQYNMMKEEEDHWQDVSVSDLSSLNYF